jgi:hypothetical protein
MLFNSTLVIDLKKGLGTYMTEWSIVLFLTCKYYTRLKSIAKHTSFLRPPQKSFTAQVVVMRWTEEQLKEAPEKTPFYHLKKVTLCSEITAQLTPIVWIRLLN